MAQSKLSVIRKSKKIEFWYDKEYFVYEKRQEKNLIAEFIWNDQKEKIYGPLIMDSTEEGLKVYKALKRKIEKESDF